MSTYEIFSSDGERCYGKRLMYSWAAQELRAKGFLVLFVG